jgi:hypothetical protein
MVCANPTKGGAIVARERVREYAYAGHTCTEYVQAFKHTYLQFAFFKFELVNTAISGPPDLSDVDKSVSNQKLLIDSSI